MASTNQSPFYQRAEQEFHEATSDDERIACLEIMIKECPKHKSSENMLRNLKIRLKKLREKSDKQRKSGKSTQSSIKKADMQCVLVGGPNSGKSSLFNLLTGLNEKVSPHPFTTVDPRPGSFSFENASVQVIDIPSFPNHDKSLVNTADTVIVLLTSLDELSVADELLYRAKGKKIFLFNKSDMLSEEEKRKLTATFKSKHSKKYFLLWSNYNTPREVEVLKKEIFSTFPVIRIFTKEPKKDASDIPMILRPGSTVKSVAEKILKGMSKRVKRSRIWGPSSKFSGQVVGLDHVLRDGDTVEFQTE